MRPRGILETALYVDDLVAARRFYLEVMGLEIIVDRPPRQIFFRSGNDVLLLFDPTSTERDETHVGGVAIPRHGAHGAGHLCFAIADLEIDAWRAHLTAHGVPIEAEVAWPRGGRSLYFRDPAGNSLELASPRIWGLPESVGL